MHFAGVLYPMIRTQIWTAIFLNLFLTTAQLMQPMLLKTMLLFCAQAYYCQESFILEPMRQACSSEVGGAESVRRRRLSSDSMAKCGPCR